MFDQLAVGLDRRPPRDARTSLRMPYYQLIGPGRDVLDGETPVRIGQRVVGIVDGHRPTFHVGVEAALHVERAPPFVQIERPDQRLTRCMVVHRTDVAPVVLIIHDQGRIEQHARAGFDRGLVALDIVHDRIPIDDFHRMTVPNDGHEGGKLAIPRFDQGDGQLEWFARVNAFQQNEGILQPTLLTHHEIMKESPTSSIGNTPTVGLIGKRDEVEAFGLRHGTIECDCTFNRPAMLNSNHVVGKRRPRTNRHGREHSCRHHEVSDPRCHRFTFHL